MCRHYDYFFHEGATSNGGNRLATVLMYLADVEEGGETTFPNVPAPKGVNEVCLLPLIGLTVTRFTQVACTGV